METRNKKKTPRNRKRACKCRLHELVTADEEKVSKRLFTVANRDFPEEYLNILISKQYMGKYAKHICDLCLQRGGEMCANPDGDSNVEYRTDESSATSASNFAEMDVTTDSSDMEDDADEPDIPLVSDECKIINLLDQVTTLIRGTSITPLLADKINDFLAFIGFSVIRPKMKREYDEFSSVY